MEQNQTNQGRGATPKDFFFWLGALVTLGASVYAFIDIVFACINYAYPNALAYGDYTSYASGMAYSMAVLIVMLPVFLVLMRFIRKDIIRDPSRMETWVRRWALFFILFAAAVTFITDLIVLLYTFLSGEELSIRFALKVLVVLLVSGGGFLHFLADLRGYWKDNMQKASLVGYAVIVVALFAIGTSFYIVGTPATQRAIRFDQSRVSDLQTIQWQIVSYYQAHRVLPKDLAQLTDSISGFVSPKDPETQASYIYTPGERYSFNLCATFSRASLDDSRYEYGKGGVSVPTPIIDGITETGRNIDSWAHPEGDYCFERVIDPERYPPFENRVPTKI